MEHWLNPLRVIFYILNIFIVILIIYLFFSKSGVKQNKTIKQQIAKIEERNRELEKNIKDIENRINWFRELPDFQKYVIHKETGYLAPDETLVIFEE
ncbi:septum formation initiator family protein [bacterium]|nr:septum formation initiator family protein [bacterium]